MERLSAYTCRPYSSSPESEPRTTENSEEKGYVEEILGFAAVSQARAEEVRQQLQAQNERSSRKRQEEIHRVRAWCEADPPQSDTIPAKERLSDPDSTEARAQAMRAQITRKRTELANLSGAPWATPVGTAVTPGSFGVHSYSGHSHSGSICCFSFCVGGDW